jgi:hypothetical protein
VIGDSSTGNRPFNRCLQGAFASWIARAKHFG